MRSLVLLLASCTMFGCATTVTRAGAGVIYSDVKDSVNATAVSEGSKTGTACATSILGAVATGDMSIEAAKKAGGIRKVSSVDYHVNGILGVYNKACTIVKGE